MTIAEQLQGYGLIHLALTFPGVRTFEGVLFTFKDNSTLLWADGEFWRDK